jgi:murein DD-endopeptidase MepM/ murein hydrolase activator NlpD
MPSFPLPFRPKDDYHRDGLSYGSRRNHGRRKHAACDLIAPPGTEIYAVEDGMVVRGPYGFYNNGVKALEFKLKSSGRIVRYCEIRDAAPGVHVGSTLKEGDLIAIVGMMNKDSMLHFEMYEGTATGDLTDRSNKGFERRKDLMDPTEYLDSCAVRNVVVAHHGANAATHHAATHHKKHGHHKAHAHHKAGALPVRWIR